MDAIETLMNDHRLIERALDGLVAFADEVRRKSTDDKAELARFVGFIREFADAHHHGKEEDVLFAAMVEAGFPRQGGPIAVMLHEHDQGRAFVGTLAELSTQAAPWSRADYLQRVADAAYGYSNLLHDLHIHKEDAILYPMAEQRLAPEVLARVSAECERLEQQKTASGDLERLHQLAAELLARHAPLTPDAHQARTSASGCC